ncbi:MAG: hypothetical protein ACREQA_04540 [Candidatus Binatia bacterium]
MKLLLSLSLVLSLISLVSINPLLSQELDAIAKAAFKKEMEELKRLREKAEREKALKLEREILSRAEIETKAPEAADPPGSLLSPKIKFRPEGQLKARVSFLQTEASSTYEEGTYNGVTYRFHHEDGSGAFGRYKDYIMEPSLIRQDLEEYKDIIGWSITCQQNKMEDMRYCFAESGDLLIYLTDNGFLNIKVGGDQYPGSEIAVRFGNEKPLSATKHGWFGDLGGMLLQRLMSSASVVTRYKKRPGATDVEREVDLSGLREAFEYMQFAVTQPLSASFKK